MPKKNLLLLLLCLLTLFYSKAYSQAQKFDGLSILPTDNSIELIRLKIELTGGRNGTATIESKFWSRTPEGKFVKQKESPSSDYKLFSTPTGFNLTNQQNQFVFAGAFLQGMNHVQLSISGKQVVFFLGATNDVIQQGVERQIDFMNNGFYEKLNSDIQSVISMQARWNFFDSALTIAKNKFDTLKQIAGEARQKPNDKSVKDKLKAAKTDLDNYLNLTRGVISSCEYLILSGDLDNHKKMLAVRREFQILPYYIKNLDTAIREAEAQKKAAEGQSQKINENNRKITDLELQKNTALKDIALN